jgi:hypothetical protein
MAAMPTVLHCGIFGGLFVRGNTWAKLGTTDDNFGLQYSKELIRLIYR